MLPGAPGHRIRRKQQTALRMEGPVVLAEAAAMLDEAEVREEAEVELLQPEAAAAGASPAEVASAAKQSAASKQGGVKRRRGSAAAEDKVAAQRVKMSKKQQLIIKVQTKQTPLSKRDRESVEIWKQQLVEMDADLKKMLEALEAARRGEAARAEAEKRKAEAAALKEEATRHMSDAGQCVLVELVMKAQARLTNTSDKVETVWAADIHKKFMAAVERGDLPEGDGRSVKSLRDRCAAAPAPVHTHATHNPLRDAPASCLARW